MKSLLTATFFTQGILAVLCSTAFAQTGQFGVKTRIINVSHMAIVSGDSELIFNSNKTDSNISGTTILKISSAPSSVVNFTFDDGKDVLLQGSSGSVMLAKLSINRSKSDISISGSINTEKDFDTSEVYAGVKSLAVTYN